MVDNGVRNDLDTRSMASINHLLKLLSAPPLGDDFVGYRLSEGVLTNNLMTCSLLAYLVINPPGVAYDMLLRRRCYGSVIRM